VTTDLAGKESTRCISHPRTMCGIELRGVVFLHYLCLLIFIVWKHIRSMWFLYHLKPHK
jgi:hypothetical protein